VLAWQSDGNFKGFVVGCDDSKPVALKILPAEMAFLFIRSEMPKDGAGQYSKKIFARFDGWRNAEHQGRERCGPAAWNGSRGLSGVVGNLEGRGRWGHGHVWSRDRWRHHDGGGALCHRRAHNCCGSHSLSRAHDRRRAHVYGGGKLRIFDIIRP